MLILHMLGETKINYRRIFHETEELHHEAVGLDVGRLIQQGRQAKNLTQKDLATVIKIFFIIFIASQNEDLTNFLKL